jgi:hypothetical protein
MTIEDIQNNIFSTQVAWVLLLLTFFTGYIAKKLFEQELEKKKTKK